MSGRPAVALGGILWGAGWGAVTLAALTLDVGSGRSGPPQQPTVCTSTRSSRTLLNRTIEFGRDSMYAIRVDQDSIRTRCVFRRADTPAPAPPAAPAPVGDTTIVRITRVADTNQLAPGQQIGMCVLYTFGDGRQAIRTPEQAECPRAWERIERRATAGQQAVADRQCVTWTVSGGTFRPSVACDRVSEPA